MKTKTLLITIVALSMATGAFATQVSANKAARAATAWAAQALTAGAKAGVTRVDAIETEAKETFYAAKLAGSGTVLVSGDTLRRPIIAYIKATNDFSTIDNKSPLWALLNKDQQFARLAAQSASANGAQSSGLTEAEREWKELVPNDLVAESPCLVSEAATAHVGASNLTDLRVNNLVQSKWRQDNDYDGNNCFNYYTPKLNTGKNAFCGCVATAMAQIMRYHRYPTQAIDPFTRQCYIHASTKNKSAITMLTSKEGAFDWKSMPLYPCTTATTESQRKAIGKLTYNAGVSVYMSYDVGGSGAFAFNAGGAFRDVFKYAQANYYHADEVSSNASAMQKALLANFDAGYPVLMGISGDGGHAVVGDGYGYKGNTLFVHLNMGWANQEDVWYNLPAVDTSSYKFTVFDDVVFNIFPTDKEKSAILSGHVVDDEGVGANDMVVKIYSSDVSKTLVASDVTTNGVYGVRVKPGTYDVVVTTADGKMSETIPSVSVSGTVSDTFTWSGWIIQNSWYEDYDNISTVSSVGNIGNKFLTDDLVVYKPTVRMGENRLYASLNKAISAAKTISEGQPNEPVVIEVIDATALENSCTIDFPCVLTATNLAMTVERIKEAKLSVAEGGSLALSNIVFNAASSVLVEVASGARLEVGENADLGVDKTTVAVRTQEATGLILSGKPGNWFSVDCVAARAVGNTFAYTTVTPEVFSSWKSDFGVEPFVNLNDKNGELAGAIPEESVASPYPIVWELLPVPFNEAIAYYVTADQPLTTNCYRRLDRLFELFEQVTSPATITIVTNATLTRKVTPKSNLRIVSSDGAVISGMTAETGFVVNDGVTLSLEGVSFEGDGSDALASLFLVNGGELELGGDIAIRNITGANKSYSCVVTVLSGSASLSNVAIENCVNPMQGSNGGAIYLKNSKASLTLRDNVTIAGCNARSNGGAIYVGQDAAVNLSGYLSITGNTTRADGSLKNDIYCYRDDDEPVTLNVVGPIETGSAIGVRAYGSDISKIGGIFASVDPLFTDKNAIAISAKAFVNNEDDTLTAQASDDYNSLVWAAPSEGVQDVDEAAASVAVVFPDSTRKYYLTLEDAFGVLTAGGTIEVMKDVTLTSDISVQGSVTLTSEAGETNTVTRAAGCRLTIPAEASLEVKDIVLDGRLDEKHGGDGTLLSVEFGSLTFARGAILRDVTGSDLRPGAIKVYKGLFTMLDGAEIRDCTNFWSKGDCVGAITADSLSTLRLKGGRIANCAGNLAGAIWAANETTVEISGGFSAINNASTETGASNLFVAEEAGELVLADVFSGEVGLWPDGGEDAAVFGSVSADFSGTDAELANSAHHFTNDLTGDIGFALRNGDETILVWGSAIDVDGNYTDENEKVWSLVPGGDALQAVAPEAAAGLVYSATTQTGVDAGFGYVVTGGEDVNAGSHEATLTLKAGYVWSDDFKGPVRTIEWSIAPAELTVTANAMSKVRDAIEPAAFTYVVTGLKGGDTAMSVLTGALVREEGESVGEYSINQGTLAVVGGNYTLVYNPATFTITEPAPTPDPEEPEEPEEPEPETVQPEPIAFSLIERQGSEWVLVATNATKDCEYSLRSGTNLDTNSWTETAWQLWSGETGPMTNRVQALDSESARFWIILGRPKAAE